MIRAKVTFLILLWVGILRPAQAQHVAIENNLLYDFAAMLSAGIEIPCSKYTSLEMYGSFRPWKRGETKVHKHWSFQGQYRIWPCQVMNSWFFGPYGHVAQFNIGKQDFFPFELKNVKDFRYEGWLAGAGIGIGYEYALSKHWNIAAEVGAGYTYINYKKYDCAKCGVLRDDDVYHYWGVSKLGLSIMYVF